MAVIPISGSNIDFLKGVPFSNDYKNTRWFDNETDQVSYFDSRSLVHKMIEATFVENNGKAYVSVDAPIDSLRDTNYMRFRNTGYSNKWFYAFVTKLERKNRSVTYVYFEIDVLQTWRFKINIKPSFVVREHCPLWNPDGTPVVNTADEGLDYGLEYDDVHVTQFIPNKNIKFLVMVTTMPLHGTNAGKNKARYNGVAQPLCWYVLPMTLDGEGVIFVNSDGGETPMTEPEDFLNMLQTAKKSDGDIASIYVTESIGCPISVTGGGETFLRVKFTEKDQKFEAVQVGESGSANENISCLYLNDLKRYKTETYDLGGKYSGVPSYTETKLYMYPYTLLTLDDFKGNRTDYKIEYIYDSNILLNIKGSLGTSNKVSYGMQKYNDKASMTNHQDNQYALINNNSQDIPVISNLLNAYLQGNKNSIENQKAQINFNGAMNVASSGLQMAGGMAMMTNPVTMAGGVSSLAGGAVGAVKGAGNAHLQMEALQAKQKDIGNMPPQLSKQGSNTSYDMGHRYDGITLIKKTLKPEYRKRLEQFFNMFGYKKNEIKIPALHTRKNWNYVETKSCNITGDLNNEDLNEIKQVFDGGITLWHTNDIGNYALSNEVL
jgi:hypothetical protein